MGCLNIIYYTSKLNRGRTTVKCTKGRYEIKQKTTHDEKERERERERERSVRI